MSIAHSIGERLRRQAQTCAQMGSRFYAALLEYAAEDYDGGRPVRVLLDRHEERSRIGIRLSAAAHFRALHGGAPHVAAHFPSTGGDGDARKAWQAIARDLVSGEASYDALLARPVQTNEVARAMPVLGAMLRISAQTELPLRIFEAGASAGLIGRFDRFRYEGGSWSWGDPSSPLVLRNETRTGAPANLYAKLHVAERAGCDLHPLDPADAADADTLLSFVWADQTERFERLRAALSIARTVPMTIDKADAVEWLSRRALPRAGSVTVVLHTVMTEHLKPEQRQTLLAAIESNAQHACAAAPMAWVRMEPGGTERPYEISATLWSPQRWETIVARSDGHGQRLEWCAA